MLCCQECYTEPDWHDLPAAEIKLNDYNAQSAWVIWRLAGAFRLMRSTNGAPDKGSFVSRHPSLSAAQAKARAENPYINIWCEDEGGGFTRIYNAMTD
jgi:hypothetical protein